MASRPRKPKKSASKKKNTGKEYERLTQQIFQAVLKHQGVETVSVEHDVKITGRSTTHQIDVFWRFRHGPVEHTVIVQCKDHESRVKQLEMLAFRDILSDIPGQPRGIFVTRTGFQKGAIEVGRASGIAMKTLRKPLEKDWEGRLRNISFDVHMTVPEVRRFRPLVDEAWYWAERKRLGLAESGKGQELTFRGDGESIVFEDDGGNILMSANHIANELVKLSGFEHHDWLLRRFTFEKPLFLRTGDALIPRVRTVAAEVEIRKRTTLRKDRVEIRGDDVIAYLLEDVLDGSRATFDHDLKLRGQHGSDDESGDDGDE